MLTQDVALADYSLATSKEYPVVEEIMKQTNAKVGYINYTSFSRVFSRYTGISPIEYKNLSISNHQETESS